MLPDKVIITEKNKLLAEYMGLQYFPHNDLQGLPKAGWWEVAPFKKDLSEYIFFNPKNGWVKYEDKRAKFICRNHHQLRYFNDYNLLMEVAEKLEKEDLRKYFYSWQEEDEVRFNFEGVSVERFDGIWDVSVSLALDPPVSISNRNEYRNLSDRQQLFFSLVAAVEYINNLKK